MAINQLITNIPIHRVRCEIVLESLSVSPDYSNISCVVNTHLNWNKTKMHDDLCCLSFVVVFTNFDSVLI